MIRTSFICLLLAAGSTRALDLTPFVDERELEGFRIPIVRFGDGKRRVSYRPPQKWRVAGTETDLSLFPPNRTGCSVKFSLRSRQPGPQEGGDAREELKKWAQNLLPADAGDIAVLGEKASPFMLGKLASHEFIFGYEYRGVRFTRSVAVVDISDSQRFMVVVDARPEDFESIHKETTTSMFSWQWDD